MQAGTSKRRRRAKRGSAGSAEAPPGPADAGQGTLANSQDAIAYSNLALHDLFQQQTRQMLDRTDLDEDQKQTILIAMSCPCCGAGGLSFTAKLKRRT